MIPSNQRARDGDDVKTQVPAFTGGEVGRQQQGTGDGAGAEASSPAFAEAVAAPPEDRSRDDAAAPHKALVYRPAGKLEDKVALITGGDSDRTFRTNIYAYFHMAKASIPRMQRGSTIINTGSITGLEGSKDLFDYSATKGAIHAFTKSLAQSLVDRGIPVNCVAPGPVWTPLKVVAQGKEDVSNFGEDTPMGAGAARGDGAGVCVLRLERGFEPRSRRGPRPAWPGVDSRLGHGSVVW
ncbi:MAG TPA: SDR family oxidoreductase [Gemmatimonadaceae bacterium]|nr:SDR family oxidoreductase [Gemmatimonadaceae bacterium]